MSDEMDRLGPAWEALRETREAAAGNFAWAVAEGRAREATRRREAARRRRRVGWALALAAPVVVVGAALHLQERAEARRALELAREVEALASWRGPTEALLTDAYTVWMQGSSALHASAVDLETTTGGS